MWHQLDVKGHLHDALLTNLLFLTAQRKNSESCDSPKPKVLIFKLFIILLINFYLLENETQETRSCNSHCTVQSNGLRAIDTWKRSADSDQEKIRIWMVGRRKSSQGKEETSWLVSSFICQGISWHWLWWFISSVNSWP